MNRRVALCFGKRDVHPDKLEAYRKWTESAIKRSLAVPGVVEFRAYWGFAGAPQIIATWEFADMAAWAAWVSSETMQQLDVETHTMAVNVTSELWGPSPVAPAPIRP